MSILFPRWRGLNSHLDKLDAALIICAQRQVVQPAGAELVAGVVDELVTEEVAQDGHQAAPVPVVRDATTIVTLSSHVGQGRVGNLVIFVDEHLEWRERFGYRERRNIEEGGEGEKKKRSEEERRRSWERIEVEREEREGESEGGTERSEKQR